MLNSFEDLKALFTSKNIPFHADDTRSALEIPTYIRNEPMSAVLLWDPRATLFHVIQPLPIDVPQDREGEVMKAVVRINHSLVLPGFGYDHEQRRLYFRWVVPRELDGPLHEQSLDRAIRTVLETCRDFIDPLRAVATGPTPASEVVAMATRQREAEEAARQSL